MRKTVTVIAVLVIGLAGASRAFSADVCTSATNLVQNCGFETGTLSGWIVSGTDSASLDNGIYYGVSNSAPYSGSYGVYMGALGGNMVLSQTLSNLIPTDVYTITFELFNDTTPDTGYINNFSVSLGNITDNVLSQAVAGNYTKYTVVAGAFSTSAALSFSSRNDAGFWNLDSIQVVQTGTPEPSTLMLLGTALVLFAGAGALRRRIGFAH